MSLNFLERGSGSGLCPEFRGLRIGADCFCFLGFGVVRGKWCGWEVSVALLRYCGLAPRGGCVGVDFGVQFILDEF